MSTILRRDRPHIFCEVLPGRETGPALERLLAPHGYRFFHLTPAGPVPRQEIIGHPAWLNYLFTTLSAEEVLAMWAAAPVPSTA
jgi:hypothetical protein